MSEPPDRLTAALDRFDEVNAEDPRSTLVEGRPEPIELVYGRRMTETLESFEPDPSEALRLAARAQHIARWRIPRSEYPPGRKGYRSWRSRLMDYHAEIAGGILREVGYGDEVIERVGTLLRKRGLKRDLEVQTLEDVACLVFLEHYFDDFADGHEDDKLVEILRKTLKKMSQRGRAAALDLELGERGAALVARAQGEPPE